MEQLAELKLPQARPRTSRADRFKELDEIGALNLNLTGRVLAKKVLQCGPTEQRGEDTRALNCHSEIGIHIGTERNARPIPQLHGNPAVEQFTQMHKELVRGLELPSFGLA